MGMLSYFAYGSNIDVPRLRSYLAGGGLGPDEVTDPRRAVLLGYQLRTNYLSATHGAAACNIEPDRGQVVEGVVMQVSSAARDTLRLKEGYPYRYREEKIAVEVPPDTGMVAAFTFVVSPRRRLAEDLPVTKHYRSLILEAAAQRGFSDGYMEQLRAILRVAAG